MKSLIGKREAPVSVRFNGPQRKQLGRLLKKWKLSVGATIHKALELAENQNGDKR